MVGGILKIERTATFCPATTPLDMWRSVAICLLGPFPTGKPTGLPGKTRECAIGSVEYQRYWKYGGLLH